MFDEIQFFLLKLFSSLISHSHRQFCGAKLLRESIKLVIMIWFCVVYMIIDQFAGFLIYFHPTAIVHITVDSMRLQFSFAFFINTFSLILLDILSLCTRSVFTTTSLLFTINEWQYINRHQNIINGEKPIGKMIWSTHYTDIHLYK